MEGRSSNPLRGLLCALVIYAALGLVWILWQAAALMLAGFQS